jgi:protein O-mannosyl-transferase
MPPSPSDSPSPAVSPVPSLAPSLAGDSPSRGRLALIAIILGAMAFGLFARTLDYGFVNIDDRSYVTENTVVLEGLTAEGIGWAFTESHAANWHPLTWISHMLDVEFFGLDAGAHHRTNALLHALGSALLFLGLFALTRRVGASAVVAALFAVHPTHVESVAWISERKDVLSGVFFMLTLIAWASWVRRPSPRRYAIVCIVFGLGLMSKPMLVVLPPILLLLDVWPLRRRVRVVEKLPLFALAALSCVVTVLAQGAGGATEFGSDMSLAARLLNALSAYGAYLRMSVWPSGLAVFYPHPIPFGSGSLDGMYLSAGVAAVLLAMLTGLALRVRRQAPYLLVGWLWFLGALVPVLGLLQVGGQAYADRYTYLPAIGLYIAAVWGGAELLRRRGAPSMVGRALAAGVVLAAAAVAWPQVGTWESDRTLFTRAAEVTEDNYVAYFNLGVEAYAREDLEHARIQLERTIAIAPTHADARSNLGIVLMRLGRAAEALPHLRRASELEPLNVDALHNVGQALLESGDPEAALTPLRGALALEPARADTRFALGLALLNLRRRDEAIGEFEATIEATTEAHPEHLLALQNLAGLSLEGGDPQRAEVFVRRVLHLQPDHPTALYQMGLIHAGRGEFREARARFNAVLRLVPDHRSALRQLQRLENR